MNEQPSPAVRQALELRDAWQPKLAQMAAANEPVAAAYQSALSTETPRGAHLLRSKRVFAMCQAVSSRLGPWQWRLHSHSNAHTEAAEASVATLLRRAQLPSVLRGRDGVFVWTPIFGDSFVLASYHAGTRRPLRLQKLSPGQVFFNESAQAVRGSASGQNARTMLVIMPMDPEKAEAELGPKALKHIGQGPLPGGQKSHKPMYEIGLLFDTSRAEYTMFGGPSGRILAQHHGPNYPFWLHGEPQLPLLHFGFDSLPGSLYSRGVGHYAWHGQWLEEQFGSALLASELRALRSPVLMPVAPEHREQAEVALLEAEDRIAAGQHGIIWNELDDAGRAALGEATRADPGTRTRDGRYAQQVLAESERLYGINMSEARQDPYKKAAVSLREARASFEVARRFSSRNADQFQFLLSLLLSCVQRFSSHNAEHRFGPLSLAELARLHQQHALQAVVDEASGIASDPLLDTLELRQELERAQMRAELRALQGQNNDLQKT